MQSTFCLVMVLLFSAITGLKQRNRINASLNTASPAGTTLNAIQGSIFSPNYPQNYPQNTTVIWDIWMGVQPTASLEVNFSYFDIEDCQNCACDYIEFVSVNMSVTPQKFCGSVLPNGDGIFKLTHVSGYVRIRFISNTNSIQRSGFFANYKVTGKTDNSIFPEHFCYWQYDVTFNILMFCQVSTTPTTTLGTTVSCFAILCPQCLAGEAAVYRYFHNDSCPSFCECQQTTTTSPTQITSTYTGVTTKKPCTETYANQGYIKTLTHDYPGYPPLYFLNYDCDIRVDLGKDYILKDKSVRFRFLKFDLDHCKYGYDGHTCRCDYVKLINVRGLENERICDSGYIDFNKNYFLRPSSRSDRYLEMKFHSDSFLVKTGYFIEYEVIDAHFPVCTNSTCSTTCNLGHVEDFAGCTMCQCVTTTTTTTRATTTRTTTPTLYKSRLLTKLQGIINEMQSLYKEVQHSRLVDYGR